MGVEQPYPDEPADDDAYVINETVNLEREGDRTFHTWELDLDETKRLRGRAIARGGHNITIQILEEDEFEHYENGEDYWFEHESPSGSSISFEERLMPGKYVLVVQSHGGGDSGPKVKFEVWTD